MKKLFVLIVLGLLIMSSCKTSGGHCDAYGNKSGHVTTEDGDTKA